MQSKMESQMTASWPQGCRGARCDHLSLITCMHIQVAGHLLLYLPQTSPCHRLIPWHPVVLKNGYSQTALITCELMQTLLLLLTPFAPKDKWFGYSSPKSFAPDILWCVRCQTKSHQSHHHESLQLEMMFYHQSVPCALSSHPWQSSRKYFFILLFSCHARRKLMW